MDWEKAEIGITKRAAAAAAPSENFRIAFNILILPLPVNYQCEYITREAGFRSGQSVQKLT
jgi:hypothetical protein